MDDRQIGTVAVVLAGVLASGAYITWACFSAIAAALAALYKLARLSSSTH